MVDLIALQMTSSASIAKNLDKAERLIAAARVNAQHPALLVLPECFSQFGCAGASMLEHAEPKSVDATVQACLSALAKRYNLYLIGGTVALKGDNSRRYHAASLVYDPTGKCISQYNKMHLFDVEVDDNTRSYKESKYTLAGKHLAKFDSPWGLVGQAVCYDLRFAKMFDALMPANVMVLPSAFTYTTGKAHWHALLQARSIELQCYIVAANQVGIHADGRKTFGHSCVYSPWGECLSVIEQDEGWASARFDKKQLEDIRANMPIASHKKERYEFE